LRKPHKEKNTIIGYLLTYLLTHLLREAEYFLSS